MRVRGPQVKSNKWYSWQHKLFCGVYSNLYTGRGPRVGRRPTC